MKSTRAFALLLALTALAFGLPANAQSSWTGADRPHFYAGGTAGFNDDEEVGWRVLGGYQINRNFAAEIGYHRLGDMTAGGFNFNPRAWEVLGLAGIPVGPVSVYGKLGLFRGTKTPGSDNTDLTYGAGVQYELARNIALRGEWQRYNGLNSGGGDHDADVMSVGAIFRFN